jgi:bacterial/archaeal transporter family-2 protein
MLPRKREIFYYVIVVGVGVGSTQQMAINTRLASFMGIALISAFWNFLVGLFAIYLVYHVLELKKRFDSGETQVPPKKERVFWPYLTGVLGSVFVAGTIFGAIGIGIALSFAVAVAGQLLSASVIDHTGFLNTPRRPMNRFRVGAVVLACAGCGLSVSERVRDSDVGLVVGYCILVFGCGVLLPIQTAFGRNLAMRRCGGNTVLATTWSFLVGTLCLGTAAAVYSAIVLTGSYNKTLWDMGGAPGWAFTGGLFGAESVFLSFLLAPRIGMARLYTCVVFGQLVSSLLYDHYGIMGVSVTEATPLRIAGVCVVSTAAVLFSLDTTPVQPRPTPVATTMPDKSETAVELFHTALPESSFDLPAARVASAKM